MERGAAGPSGNQGRGGLIANLDLGSVDRKRLPVRVRGKSRGAPSSGGTGRGRAVRHVPSGEGRGRGADSHGGEGRAPCGRRGGADPGGNIKQFFYPSGIQPEREEGRPFCGGGAKGQSLREEARSMQGGVLGMT